MPKAILLRFMAFAFVCLPACALDFDDDVPANLKQQLEADLAMIGSIQGNGVSAIHRDIFGEVDGPQYTQWFTSRAKSVGMSDCGSPNAVACVQPFWDASKIWITQNYVKFSHPQIARLMVIYHEARHTESSNGNWSHADCPVPFQTASGEEIKSIWTGAVLAGEPACDITPEGSYGSSLILLKNVQKFCANCTEKVKMDAGFYADDQFKRIIDSDAREAIEKDLYHAEPGARVL
jgi:hypothetical protein